MKAAVKNCAIYTRKSTDERLDMEFNTLDAQRESCLAYILSQKSEGWTAVKKHYDDGGFSGGTMDRPALTELIEDIKARKVNIVVVYKIDRLTRSLMDFSKLVEVFDAHGVTFVSVTQSFNTTTSMGRLTLNVLLSFAQFEREVAGERIRDKISASKRRGMWMGGTPPIGYKVANRQLVVDVNNVKLARHIFDRYVALGSVYKLTEELKEQGIKSPSRISEKGWEYGGAEFSRGAIHNMLTNPIYIGKIKHKNNSYDGQHEAIIALDVWDAVQQKLQAQAASPRGCIKAKDVNLLQGLLFDAQGQSYGPTFSVKNGKRYRYYIEQSLRRVGKGNRIPAFEIEALVEKAIRKRLNAQEELPSQEMISAIERIELRQNEILITMHSDKSIIHVPYERDKSLKGAIVISPKGPRDYILDLPRDKLKKLVEGIIWREEHFAGMAIKDIAIREKRSESYVGTAITDGFEILASAF
jgi:site-specific DNA recombinase